MSKRIAEDKVSNTACYTCFSRACASREEDERFRGPDHMAEVFLPPLARGVLSIPVLRNLLLRKMAPPGIYEYVLARTKLLDQVFVEALEDGFSQVVLLGAGFDTRALRFADRNEETRIFELDAHATQRPKVDILTRKKVTLPEELVFVPIDFNKQSPTEALFDAGYRRDWKNLFLWEGVTMYLTPDAVDGTLDCIRNSSAAGSVVAFDYVYASVLRREGEFYGGEEIFGLVSRAGEEWTFGIEDGGVEDFLSARGFRVAAHYTPSDLEKMYLTADDGAFFERVNGTHCIVTASVN